MLSWSLQNEDFLCINISASVHTAVAGVSVLMQTSILSWEKPLLAAHLISLLKWMTWSAVRHIIPILAPGWACQCSHYRETTWPIFTYDVHTKYTSWFYYRVYDLPPWVSLSSFINSKNTFWVAAKIRTAGEPDICFMFISGGVKQW